MFLYIFLSIIKAGIPENQLEIALEPEAASIYCHLTHLDDIRKDHTSGGHGHKYMVVDLGGMFILTILINTLCKFKLCLIVTVTPCVSICY